jgi:hypothetical protein
MVDMENCLFRSTDTAIYSARDKGNYLRETGSARGGPGKELQIPSEQQFLMLKGEHHYTYYILHYSLLSHS